MPSTPTLKLEAADSPETLVAHMFPTRRPRFIQKHRCGRPRNERFDISIKPWFKNGAEGTAHFAKRQSNKPTARTEAHGLCVSSLSVSIRPSRLPLWEWKPCEWPEIRYIFHLREKLCKIHLVKNWHFINETSKIFPAYSTVVRMVAAVNYSHTYRGILKFIAAYGWCTYSNLGSIDSVITWVQTKIWSSDIALTHARTHTHTH